MWSFYVFFSKMICYGADVKMKFDIKKYLIKLKHRMKLLDRIDMITISKWNNEQKTLLVCKCIIYQMIQIIISNNQPNKQETNN